MANGFQRQAPEVRTATGPTQVDVQDNSTAQAVTALGGILGRVRQEGLERGLERSFTNLASETARISQMTPQQAENELQGADNEFRSLLRARTQGRLTETGVSLEAERILNRQIQRAPAFEDDFRRLAGDILGYDPTGTLVQSTIQASVGQDKQNGPFQSEKYNRLWRESSDLAMATGQSTETFFNAAVESQVAQQRVEGVKAQMEIGALNVEQGWNQYATNIIPEMNKSILMNTLYTRDEESGALVPRESVDATAVKQDIEARKQQVVNSFIQEAAQAGQTVNNDQISNMRDRVDSAFEPIMAIAEDRDTLERLQRNVGIIDNAYKQAASEMASDLYLAQTLGVQREFFELLKTPEKLRGIMSRLDPNIRAGMDISEMSDSVKQRVFEIAGGNYNVSDATERQAASDTARAMAGNGTEEGQRSGLEVLRDDKPVFSLSNLATPEFSYTSLKGQAQTDAVKKANLHTKKILSTDPTQQIINKIREEQQREDLEEGRFEARIEDGRLVIEEVVQGPRGEERFGNETIDKFTRSLNTIERVAENGYGSRIEDWSPDFLQRQLKMIQQEIQ